MKSNLILKSESRTLLGSPVSIMSKDGYVCITEAMDSIKKKRESMNLSAKEINDVLRNQGFKEKIRALMTQLGYGNDSLAKGMNYVVFGKHEEGIRNYASIDQMQEIVMLQGYISDMIESGFISDFNALIRYLGDKWEKRWGNINPVTGC